MKKEQQLLRKYLISEGMDINSIIKRKVKVKSMEDLFKKVQRIKLSPGGMKYYKEFMRYVKKKPIRVGAVSMVIVGAIIYFAFGDYFEALASGGEVTKDVVTNMGPDLKTGALKALGDMPTMDAHGPDTPLEPLLTTRVDQHNWMYDKMEIEGLLTDIERIKISELPLMNGLDHMADMIGIKNY